MKRILITGGAGFVGSSLALRLQEAHPAATVVALDNLYRRGSELNRERLEARGITFLQQDVRERAAFEMPACDLVIDAAAEPSVLAGRSGDAAYVVDTNLIGTLNLLEAARGWSAAVLFISTSRVYPVARLRQIRHRESPTRFELEPKQDLAGVSEWGINEDFPLDGSRTLYGATKYAAEIMVSEYAAQFGMRTLIDRCGVIAGPWQMGRVDQGVVALWVAAHHFGRPLQYIGFGGKQVRDCLHIDDFGELVTRQIEARDSWSGQVFSVGGGRAVSTSLLELTGLCETATGKSTTLGTTPDERPGDVPVFITDARRVSQSAGWSPQRDMAKIVEDTARWVRDNEERLRVVLT